MSDVQTWIKEAVTNTPVVLFMKGTAQFREQHQGNAVGCGALRPLQDDVAELKRMYARPGSDAGKHILAALEWHAVIFGYTEVWLSTRRVNRRALDFYRRNGYVPVPAYGKYVGSQVSACLGRWL